MKADADESRDLSLHPRVAIQPSSQPQDVVLDQRLNPSTNTMQYYMRDTGAMEWWADEEDVDDDLIAAWERGDRVILDDEENFLEEAAKNPHDDSEATHLDDHRISNPHSENLKRGYWSVAAGIYNDFISHKVIRNDPPTRPVFRLQCTEILASMPQKALQAICGRGLRWWRLRDAKLRWELETLRAQSRARPNAYVLELVDKLGDGTTVGEMRLILSWAESYIALDDGDHSDTQRALLIDEAAGTLDSDVQQEVLGNLRREFLIVGDDNKDSDSKKRLRTLLDAIQHNLDTSGLADGEMCNFLLRDVGYTSNGVNRIEKQHKVKRSTNKVMALFATICEVALSSKYGLHGDVVFLCTAYWHAPYGEIIFSLLAPSYHYTGRGFNTVEAGIQQNSMADFNEAKEWDMWVNSKLNDTSFYDNIEAEQVRLEKYAAEYAALEAEIEQEECRSLREEIEEGRKTLALQEEVHEALVKLRLTVRPSD